MSEHKIAAPDSAPSDSAMSRLRPPYASVLDLIGQTHRRSLLRRNTPGRRLIEGIVQESECRRQKHPILVLLQHVDGASVGKLAVIDKVDAVHQ